MVGGPRSGVAGGRGEAYRTGSGAWVEVWRPRWEYAAVEPGQPSGTGPAHRHDRPRPSATGRLDPVRRGPTPPGSPAATTSPQPSRSRRWRSPPPRRQSSIAPSRRACRLPRTGPGGCSWSSRSSRCSAGWPATCPRSSSRVAVAILLAALLSPVSNRLRAWGSPRGAATAITVLGGMALIAGALTLIGTQIAFQASTLSTSVVEGFNQLTDYLRNSPLPVNESCSTPSEWGNRIQDFLSDSQTTHRHVRPPRSAPGSATSWPASRSPSSRLFYFLYDGRGIFTFLFNFFPREPRGPASTRRPARAGVRCRPTFGPPSWSPWSTPSAC